MKENRTAPPSWEGKRSAAAPPDAEVVDKPSRRRFSPSYKLRIVEEADRCTEPGRVGCLRLEVDIDADRAVVGAPFVRPDEGIVGSLHRGR